MKYKLESRPMALKENVISGDGYRITMLTESLVRLEYSKDNVFEDRASQMALNRDFPKVNWRVVKNQDGIEIHTPKISIYYDEKKFSINGLSIQVKGNLSAYHSVWRYSEKFDTLKGTARTLDLVDGVVELEEGIISRNGFSVLDDSGTQVFNDDGWVEARSKESNDLYFFGYGHSYKDALKDFYYLCGKTPMLPRYALGNWWSRYYKYSEEEYLELMDKFQEKNIPFTVAVIDMDWHITDVDPKYGSGWTGYTWNKELFPDPKRFLHRLHERGMFTTLNVHPADGIQGYEDAYLEIATEMGVDIENEDPVVFDASSSKFMDAYFKYVHHPLEKDGVDFWWIDWQQGGSSKVEGLDPLWILNHYHFLDNQKNGKRPMTFSRYAGPGSHRYPVGFSGDTITTWESLDFQPYFNTTASNIGYGWWSHDLGGHMMGYKNDEMVARWVQFGVFTPIMRLHSSCSPFNGKEPWRFKLESEYAMSEALRLRHQLIPYIYTMNHRAYRDGIPLCTPMYYEYPENAQAYEVEHQFYFGNACIVVPITTPRIQNINMAKVMCWLPEGNYYDFYTNLKYQGGRKMYLYRNLNAIPVMIKSGNILVCTDEIEGKKASVNPEQLRVKVYTGSSGTFSLYEDDNQTCEYQTGNCIITDMKYHETIEESTFVIEGVDNSKKLIPMKRVYRIDFVGIGVKDDNQLCVTIGKESKEIEIVRDTEKNTISIIVEDVSVEQKLTVRISHPETVENDVYAKMFDLLNQAEIEFDMKEIIHKIVLKDTDVTSKLSELYALDTSRDLIGACVEILTAQNI